MRMLDVEPFRNAYRDPTRVATLVVGADGMVASASTAVARTVGRRWHEVAVDTSGTPCRPYRCPISAVFASGLPRHDVTVGVKGPDGVLGWWTASARPLLDGAMVVAVAVTLTPADRDGAGRADAPTDLEACAIAAALPLADAVAARSESPWASDVSRRDGRTSRPTGR